MYELSRGFSRQAVPPALVLDMGNQLASYFDGNPVDIFWEHLNLNGLTALQTKVLKATAKINYGETCSYKDIARKTGRPKASRYVGSVMAKNPFPVFIPCHRVVRSDGSPGGFGGGEDLKIRMLALEGSKSFLAGGR